jgi:DNA replication protein DnaC
VERDQLLLRSRVPRNHWDCTLSQIPQNSSHYPAIREYIDEIRDNLDQGKGLYFSNQPGRGKSGAAAIIAKAALAKRKTVLWTISDLMIGYAINKEEFDEDQSWEERARTCDLFIIDEFYIPLENGRPKVTEKHYYIEKLVRARIDAVKSTVFTSNMSPKAFQERYPMFYSVLSEVTTYVDFDHSVKFRPA